jgi:molybdopterin converting factor subunit 1
MVVNILAFGVAKDILKTHALTLEFDSGTTQDLKILLEEKFPSLKQLPSYLIAVNSEYSLNETRINDGDEIAIIPPVSGG